MALHTTLIFLALVMMILGLILISMAAPIVNWMIVLGFAAVFLLGSRWQRNRVEQ